MHFSNFIHAYHNCPVALRPIIYTYSLLRVLNCVVLFDNHVLTIVIPEIIWIKRPLNLFSGKNVEGRERWRFHQVQNAKKYSFLRSPHGMGVDGWWWWFFWRFLITGMKIIRTYILDCSFRVQKRSFGPHGHIF